MSNKFIPIRLNEPDTKEELKDNKVILEAHDERISKDMPIITSLDKNIVLGICCNDPDNFKKEIIECEINALYDSTMNLNVSHGKNNKTQDGLDIEFVFQLRSIAQLLVYMVNSSSWRSGEYRSYDAIDIKRKLEAIISYCNIRKET